MARLGTRSKEAGERIWALQLALAREDLAAAGDDLGVLDVEVHAAGAPEAAIRHLDEAIGAYMRAGEALEVAERAGQLRGVAELLGRSAAEAARARAALRGGADGTRAAPRGGAEGTRAVLRGGAESRVPRPPCLFDPRHGEAVTDVEWTPPGASARPVPACAVDAARVTAGEGPAVRLLSVGGDGLPYWQVPAGYAAMLVGYYAGFGGAAALAVALAGTPLGDQLGAAVSSRSSPRRS